MFFDNPDENMIGGDHDVIIVGAGPVGLFIADRLLKLKRKVTIIEFGGKIPQTREDGAGAISTGRPHHGTTIGRAFGLGGTSAFWGGQLDELRENDLTREGHEWPLAYRELHRWYRETYKLLGISEKLSNQEYRSQLKISQAHDTFLELYFTSWLNEPNFAKLYSKSISSNPDLRIFLNTQVLGVSCDESGRATHLKVSVHHGVQQKIQASMFIFAAGTVGNAQIFLNSKIKDQVPWRHNDYVGAYFHDHFAFRAASIAIADQARFATFFENAVVNGLKLQPKLRQMSNIDGSPKLNICGMFDFKSSLKQEFANLKMVIRQMRSGLLHSKMRNLPKDIAKVGASLVPISKRYLMDKRIYAFNDLGVDLIVQSEQLPKRQSYIKLIDDNSHANDRLSPVAVHWQIDGAELEYIKRFLIDVDSYLGANGLGQLNSHSINEEWHQQIYDTYHMSGGLIMSGSPSTGVVNDHGLVWNTPNVFIAGSSQFPTSGYANTTMTALALGARLAEKISKYSIK